VADDLWPEMRRIVADVAPRYVFAENVSRTAINRAADDLEALGYTARAVPLSASDMGADHVRRRYWLLAYADDKGELLGGLNAEVARRAEFSVGIWQANPSEPGVVDGVAARVDRFRAAGNGQVPIVAATAFRILNETNL